MFGSDPCEEPTGRCRVKRVARVSGLAWRRGTLAALLASLCIFATACTTMPGHLGDGESAPRGLPPTGSLATPGKQVSGLPEIALAPPLAAAEALARARATHRRETIETGIASWYGPGFAGRPTASGEIFDPAAMTAAHPELPLGSDVVVVNLENGREALLTISDRGPFIDNRVIDVSRKAARVLGFYYDGLAVVRIELITPAPLARPDNGDA